MAADQRPVTDETAPVRGRGLIFSLVYNLQPLLCVPVGPVLACFSFALCLAVISER